MDNLIQQAIDNARQAFEELRANGITSTPVEEVHPYNAIGFAGGILTTEEQCREFHRQWEQTVQGKGGN